MEPKFISFLGLARRAGKLLLGLDLLERSRIRIYALVFAEDASEKTVKNAKYHSPEAVCVETDLTKAEFGRLMGVKETAVAAVTDKGFAEQILKNARRSQ